MALPPGQPLSFRIRSLQLSYFRVSFSSSSSDFPLVSTMNLLKKKKLKTQKVKSPGSDFFFDDCPICRAMREAEKHGTTLSSSELVDAFTQARDKGAIVGGSLFDKREEKTN